MQCPSAPLRAGKLRRQRGSWWAAPRAALFLRPETELHRAGHTCRDLGLHAEDVFHDRVDESCHRWVGGPSPVTSSNSGATRMRLCPAPAFCHRTVPVRR